MRICPFPRTWIRLYESLMEYARAHSCEPPQPPLPLVLSGWSFSNDVEKAQHWEATLDWAKRNGCEGLLADLPDTEFHVSHIPKAREADDFDENGNLRLSDRKLRPSVLMQAAWLEVLRERWLEIAVHSNVAPGTYPLAFTGEGFRSLLVQADASLRPVWGTWTKVDPDQPSKRAFRIFRAAVNRAIAPHEVDHIEFLIRAH